MYQDSKVVILVMCIISVGVIGRLAKRRILQFRYFYWGLLFLCVSFLADVSEGVLWKELFHAIEHLSVAASGLLFAVACSNLHRSGAAVLVPAVELAPLEAEGTMDVVWLKAQ